MRLNKGDVVVVKSTGNHYFSKIGQDSYRPTLWPVPKDWGMKRVKNDRGRCDLDDYSLRKLSKQEVINSRKETEMAQIEKLYEFKQDGKVLFGTHLATNAEGLWVMDVKGGAPVAVSKEDVKEVVPFSIQVKPYGGGKQHVTTDTKGLKEGGLYIAKNGVMYVVVKLNTETRTATHLDFVSEIQTKTI